MNGFLTLLGVLATMVQYSEEVSLATADRQRHLQYHLEGALIEVMVRMASVHFPDPVVD